MTKYEALYIVDVTAGEEAIASTIEKFDGIITANGGAIEETAQWGVKRLAYPIDYKNEGFYVLTTFTAPPQLPLELERNFKISDAIMRFLVTKVPA